MPPFDHSYQQYDFNGYPPSQPPYSEKIYPSNEYNYFNKSEYNPYKYSKKQFQPFSDKKQQTENYFDEQYCKRCYPPHEFFMRPQFGYYPPPPQFGCCPPPPPPQFGCFMKPKHHKHCPPPPPQFECCPPPPPGCFMKPKHHKHCPPPPPMFGCCPPPPGCFMKPKHHKHCPQKFNFCPTFCYDKPLDDTKTIPFEPCPYKKRHEHHKPFKCNNEFLNPNFCCMMNKYQKPCKCHCKLDNEKKKKCDEKKKKYDEKKKKYDEKKKKYDEKIGNEYEIIKKDELLKENEEIEQPVFKIKKRRKQLQKFNIENKSDQLKENKDDENKEDENKEDENKEDENKEDENKEDENKEDENKEDENKEDENKEDENKEDENKEDEIKEDKPKEIILTEEEELTIKKYKEFLRQSAKNLIFYISFLVYH